MIHVLHIFILLPTVFNSIYLSQYQLYKTDFIVSQSKQNIGISVPETKECRRSGRIVTQNTLVCGLRFLSLEHCDRRQPIQTRLPFQMKVTPEGGAKYN